MIIIINKMDQQYYPTNIPLVPINDCNSYGNIAPTPGYIQNPNNIQQPYPASNFTGVVEGLKIPKFGKNGNKPPHIVNSYENYQNISQVAHKGIEQPLPNKFIFSYSLCCLDCFSVCGIISGFGFLFFVCKSLVFEELIFFESNCFLSDFSLI